MLSLLSFPRCEACGAQTLPGSVRAGVTRDCPLPILTVDEPIYRRLPAFLIATVDKFARLPWVGETGAFFGRVDRFADCRLSKFRFEGWIFSAQVSSTRETGGGARVGISPGAAPPPKRTV